MHFSPAIIVALYLAAAVAVGAKAITLNRSIVLWLALSFVMTPLFAAILLMIFGECGKHCPRCKGLTDLLDRGCRHCGRPFTVHEILFARLQNAGVVTEPEKNAKS